MPYPFPIVAEGLGGWEGGEGREGLTEGAPRLGSARDVAEPTPRGGEGPGAPVQCAGMLVRADTALAAGPKARFLISSDSRIITSSSIIETASSSMSGRAASTAAASLASKNRCRLRADRRARALGTRSSSCLSSVPGVVCFEVVADLDCAGCCCRMIVMLRPCLRTAAAPVS